MTDNALLTRIDDTTFEPTQQAVGPWDGDLLFGGVPAGLAVHEVERAVGISDWQAARITTDLVRPAPRTPLTVDVDLVASGLPCRRRDRVDPRRTEAGLTLVPTAHSEAARRPGGRSRRWV